MSFHTDMCQAMLSVPCSQSHTTEIMPMQIPPQNPPQRQTTKTTEGQEYEKDIPRLNLCAPINKWPPNGKTTCKAFQVQVSVSAALGGRCGCCWCWSPNALIHDTHPFYVLLNELNYAIVSTTFDIGPIQFSRVSLIDAIGGRAMELFPEGIP